MILEFAIADAYAQAFEYVKNPKSHGLINDGKTFQQNPKYPDLKPGDFTDDTIRTICSANMVLNSDRIWSKMDSPKEHFRYLREYFFKFHRKGWSGRFQSFMEENKGEDLDVVYSKIQRRNTNGAIMGILPFGYLKTISEVKNISAAHALSTHSSSTIPYAQAAALCVWYLRNNKAKKAGLELRNFLLDNVEELSYIKGDPGSMAAIDTFNVVLGQVELAIRKQKYMFQVIRDCVNLSGDTDTITALTVGIYSLTSEYSMFSADYFVDSGIRQVEIENTENRSILNSLDVNLLKFSDLNLTQ